MSKKPRSKYLGSARSVPLNRVRKFAIDNILEVPDNADNNVHFKLDGKKYIALYDFESAHEKKFQLQAEFMESLSYCRELQGYFSSPKDKKYWYLPDYLDYTLGKGVGLKFIILGILIDLIQIDFEFKNKPDMEPHVRVAPSELFWEFKEGAKRNPDNIAEGTLRIAKEKLFKEQGLFREDEDGGEFTL